MKIHVLLNGILNVITRKISEFDGVSIIDFNDQNKIISVKEYQSKSQHYYPYSK